jgi:plastocyanin
MDMSPARTRSRLALAGLVAVAGLLVSAALAGCGSDDPESADGDGSGRGGGDRSSSTGESDAAAESGCEARGTTTEEPATTVEVALDEYSIQPSTAEVPAGPVELVVANDGLIFHELVVVRHDGDPGSIPLNAAGAADLEQLDEEAEVGRLLDFMANSTCRATFDLAPGHYALLCNLVDDGFNPHYSQGMHTTFTVT